MKPKAQASKPNDPALDERVIGALAQSVGAAVLPDPVRESMKRRLLARIAGAPAPAGTSTVRREDGEWTAVSDLVQVKMLRIDREMNSQTILVRMAPGGEVVPHVHSQEEECMILEGEIEIAGHRLRAGDLHIASPGAAHGVITTVHGALLMIRSEIPPAHFSMA